MPTVDTGFTYDDDGPGSDLVEAGTEGADSGPYYLVAGSNDQPPITVSTTTVPSPGQDAIIDSVNSDSTQWIEYGDINPFQNFPDRFTGEDITARDPNDVWFDRFRN